MPLLNSIVPKFSSSKHSSDFSTLDFNSKIEVIVKIKSTTNDYIIYVVGALIMEKRISIITTITKT